jgi:hypothetical protein
MENWKREVFFWTLVLLFLLTVPVIILNAKGYRFDTSRGVFVHSGTITFKANPQAVDIRINDEIFESKKLNRINNSYNLSGLVPGDYDIEILASGFQPWNKKTQVHSGMASEFWNVLLVRDDYEREDLATAGVEKFFTSPKNDLLAYVLDSQKDLMIRIFNLTDSVVQQEFSFPGWHLVEDSKKENIEWSPDNSFLSIPVEKKIEPEITKAKDTGVSQEYEYNYFIYDFENDTSLNLAENLEKKNIHDVRWDPKQSGFLFFLDNNTLFRVNVKSFEESTQIAEGISSYDLSGSYVYYTRDSGLLFKNTLDSTDNPTQITNNFPQEENPVVSSTVVYDDSRVALILENKDFYIFNHGENGDYFRKLGSHIEEAHFSDDGKKILFWSDNEIFVYFLRDQLSQPIREENEIQNVTRYSEPIKNVQWFRDYEHIIFSSGRWIKIIEIDPRDHANCMDLENTQNPNPFVIYNSSLEKLFFIDSKDETTSLYSIDFPEKTTIFGVEIGG